MIGVNKLSSLGNQQPQRRRRTMSRQDIAGLQDGEELYEAVGHDLSYLEVKFTSQMIVFISPYE